MSEELNNQTETSEQELPLPPATFEWLVISLSMQAEMFLGRIQTDEERPTINLNAAQHYIDMLAMIQEKTKGNLTLDEQRMLENSLTELRFRFVMAAEEKRKAETA
jgi:hypothetical protein